MQFRKLRATKPIITFLVGIILASAPWTGEAWATKIISKDKIAQEQHSDNLDHIILTKSFRLRTKGKVAIFYSAECAVDGSTLADRVVVKILVDGVVIDVTDSRNFCSNNGGTALDGFAMHAQSAVANLSRGRHTIEILAHGIGIGAGESYWIADQNLTLIVEKK